jgi:hypothetical protein
MPYNVKGNPRKNPTKNNGVIMRKAKNMPLPARPRRRRRDAEFPTAGTFVEVKDSADRYCDDHNCSMALFLHTAACELLKREGYLSEDYHAGRPYGTKQE